MISYASRKAGRSSNRQFQVGIAEALELSADHFDIVVSSLLMHHLPVNLRVAALQEMWRVLRPGGTLVLAEAQNPPPRPRLAPTRAGTQLRADGAHGAAARATVAAQAGFAEIRSAKAPPWLCYVHAVKVTDAV